MADLYLHKRLVESVFSLLGQKENDITYSIGWALARSPSFLQRFLQRLLGDDKTPSQSDLVIYLQEHGEDGGFTDIEIRTPSLHIIVEAKRGWQLPSYEQMEKYASRFTAAQVTERLIVSMSECSAAYAHHYMLSEVGGVPVKHVSWREIAGLTHVSDASHAEKRLMLELRDYLSTIVYMQNQDSNRVYVVSLSYGEFAPGLTFVQVVEDRQRYFHPFGSSGWPDVPPNYIAFRYDGQLQSIHHIEQAEVIRAFHPHFPEREQGDEDGPFYLYTLGPPMIPHHEVRTGSRIVRSARVWVALDLLLTSRSISEAWELTQSRMSNT